MGLIKRFLDNKLHWPFHHRCGGGTSLAKIVPFEKEIRQLGYYDSPKSWAGTFLGKYVHFDFENQSNV